MGLFFNSPAESEEIRGVRDDALPSMTNEQLILLALSRLYTAQGIDDNVMVDLMRDRALGAKPKPDTIAL